MSIISYAIGEVKHRIPVQILNDTFTPRSAFRRYSPISIDEQILNAVIRSRVLVDCNLVGGTEALLPLDEATREMVDDYVYVFHFSAKTTQNRSILSALSVNFTDPTRTMSYSSMGMVNQSAMLQAGKNVMDAMSPIPITSTAYVQLIGENTVMVRDTSLIPSNSWLRCIMANDENLSHIQMRSWRPFAKMVEYATKAYIYKTLVIDMEMTKLYGGQELGRFKDIVDGYEDAEENYQNFIDEQWGKISMMNDHETFRKHIKSFFSAGH